MAMVFETRDDVPVICSLNARDHASETLMMEAIADEVERLRAEGVVFIAEMREPDSHGKELLVAAVTNDGGRRQWRTPLTRDAAGELTIGETVREDGVAPTS